MKDEDKSKEQLIKELVEMRQRITEVEASEAQCKRALERLWLLSSAVEQSSEGIAVFDLEGNLLFVNNTFAAMHGYSPEELVGKHLSIFHTPEQMPAVEAANQQLQQTGEFSGEIWHVRRNGTVFPALMHNSLLRDEAGNLIGMIDTLHDITELKQTEKTLALERQQLLSIFDSITEPVYVSDPETYEVLYANQAIREKFGKVIGQKCYRAFQGLDSACPFCTNERIFGKNTGQPYIWEFQNKINHRWYRCIDKAIRWPDGRMVRYEMAIDITERKQAEEGLRESEERYRQLYDEAPVGYHEINQEGKIVRVNQTEADLLGYTIQEMIGKSVWDFLAPDQRELAKRAVQEKIEKRRPLEGFERKYVCKDGREIDVYIEERLIVDKEGQITGIRSTVQDITERKRAEEALRESEKKYRTLVEQSLQGIVIIQDFRIVFANDAFTRISGYTVEELLSFPPEKMKTIIHPEDQTLVWERLRERLKGKPVRPHYEYRIIRKDGSVCWLEMFASRINYRGKPAIQAFIIDITERKRAENITSALYGISKAVHSTTSLDELFHSIHKSLGTIIDTTNFFVALYDKEKDIVSFPYFVDEKDEYTTISLRDSGTLTAEIIETGKPILINQEQYRKRLAKGELKLWGTLPDIWLGVPLKIKNDVIGIVAVQSYTNPNLYSEKDIQLMESISEQVAIAIERKQAEQNIKRRLEYEKTIATISSRFVGVSEIDDAINTSLSEMGILSGASRVYLFLLREHGARMDNTHEWCAEGVSPQIDNLQDLPSEMFPWWMRKLRKGEFIHIKDVSKMPAEAKSEKEILESQDIKSLLVLPLNVGGELAGFIGFDNVMETGEWSDDNLVLLQVSSEIIGNALERKRAEEALAAEKERLAVTLRSIGDGVITTTVEGQIVLMNKVAEKLTGWKEQEAIGKSISEIFHIINEKTRERCTNPVKKVIETGVVVGLANRTILISRDGTERIIADSGAPIRDKDSKIIGVVLVFRDITERRKLEEELQKASKLESIGVLAGGIAHDFNNILTGIMGNISLAKMDTSPEDDIYKILTEAETASLRAKDLTQQLLTFSKGGAPIKKTTAISELVKDSTNFALRGSNVRCEFSIPDDLWPVEIDEGQMSQVINNLIINADQAMPEGGIIKVRVENVTVGAEHALPLKNGKYVKISIKDHGIGIPEEHLQKIFDPYFTTKQKGSGLGLATAYSIIKKHDGYITVESELGVGTTLYIYLPAHPKEILTKKDVEEKPIPGKGKILLMDDEELVRYVAGKMLKRMGYEVDVARDGTEAIELYRKAKESGQPFDVIIMDLTVPGGMGGEEAMKKLLEIDPEVKVIVSSGYSNDPIMANFRQYGFSGFIAKPYKIEELSKTLHSVLENGNE